MVPNISWFDKERKGKRRYLTNPNIRTRKFQGLSETLVRSSFTHNKHYDSLIGRDIYEARDGLAS